MQRFWKGLAIFGVVGIFYVGHGLHQYRLPGESVAEAQYNRVAPFPSKGVEESGPAREMPRASAGTYQLVWIQQQDGDPVDFGLRRLNTGTGEVDRPHAVPGRPGLAANWMTLALR